MAINAADVKKLRDITGAGMMDCKKALTEANGDFAQAEKILKEMGLAAVAKRQDRATENGRVFVKSENGKAVVLSLSCETDFVAGNAEFAKLGEDLCSVILAKGYTEINEELEGMVNALIAVIKENMHLVRFSVYDVAADEYAATYIHGNGAVAVLVLLKSDKPEIFKEADVEDIAHNLALHAAAYKPQFLSDKKITVVTNSLRVMSECVAKENIKLLIPPGIMRSHEGSIYGTETVDYLSRFHFDVFFMGVGGIDENAGLTDYSLEDVSVKQTLIRNSLTLVTLADSSKINRITFAKISNLDEMDILITNRKLSAAMNDYLDKADVRVVLAAMEEENEFGVVEENIRHI